MLWTDLYLADNEVISEMISCAAAVSSGFCCSHGSVADRSHHTWSCTKNGGLLTCWTRFLLCIPLDYRADFCWPRPGREISARTLWLKDSNQRSEPVKISITQTDLEWTWRLSDSPTCGNKEAHIDSRSTSTPAQARCCFPPFSSVIRASVADAVR